MDLSENNKMYIWSLKYRPTKIDECILPEQIKEKAKSYIKDGNVPNLLFAGTPGIGKTTLAYAIAREVGADVMYINCSDETGVDTIRGKILSFATTVSLTDSKKLVILDEFDNMSAQAYMAFRAILESVSDNCTFVATCNYKNRIPDNMLSRFTTVEFTSTKADKLELGSQFFKRVSTILKNENVVFDKKVVGELVMKFFPDFRKTLNELQAYAASGEIDSGILVNVGEENFKVLVKALAEKNFKNMRQWVVDNTHLDYSQVYRMLYEHAFTVVVKQSLPQLILILARYQHMHTSVVDRELNMVACLVEIMADVEFEKQ